MSITASISFDRQSMMSQLSEPGAAAEGSAPGGRGGFDKTQFADIMGSAAALSLEEYQTYATAESVQDFYYTLTASLDGGDGLEPVSTESETESSASGSQSMGGMNGKGAMRGFTSSGDFQLTGYSGESAMTSFLDGTCAITDGTVFEKELRITTASSRTDEPTGNLDGETQDEIMAIFRNLAAQGKCVILVSHSPQVAALCDEVYELKRLAGRKGTKKRKPNPAQ